MKAIRANTSWRSCRKTCACRVYFYSVGQNELRQIQKLEIRQTKHIVEAVWSITCDLSRMPPFAMARLLWEFWLLEPRVQLFSRTSFYDAVGCELNTLPCGIWFQYPSQSCRQQLLQLDFKRSVIAKILNLSCEPFCSRCGATCFA